MRLFIIITLIALTLSGCAATYKPSPFFGSSGYSSRDINSNTVSVNYLDGRANGERVKSYALYRCAEITVERGFEWFRLKEGSTRTQSGGYVNYASSTFVIEMYKGKPPATQQHISNQEVFVAKDVLKQLASSIQR